MRLRARSVELFVTECATRLPFRFGAVTMTRAPLLVARVEVGTEAGRDATGYSSDLLVPRWFDKDPEKSMTRNWLDLIESAERAGAELTRRDAPESAVFDHWWRVYQARVPTRGVDDPSLLVRGFGVALVERAVIDAACRAAEQSFFGCLKSGLLGFRPGDVHAELSGWDLAASLAEAPLASIPVRHTVGGADPLRTADISPEERVEDGLPQALEEDIARYGLKYFKVKIGAGRAADHERVLAIAELVRESVSDSARFTLDGNEQYDDLKELAALLRGLAGTGPGDWFLERLLFVEQPIHRTATFDPARNEALPLVTEVAPVIIDEADVSLDAFRDALALGYRGVSVKNCKGVFRALLNRGLCEHRGGSAFQSAEDLTNLPVHALQQDLATVAALGLAHVERNGHHYFRGLSHLPAGEAAEALATHPDLYAERGGEVLLDIRNGELALGTLEAPGYGTPLAARTSEREPASAWAARQS